MKVTLLKSADADIDVVNAARVSFAKKSGELSPGVLSYKDINLIRYLAEHNHVIPFAHPQIRMHLEVPLFILRQLERHKIGAISTEKDVPQSEVSRRYVSGDPTFYKPDYWRPSAANKKQGSLDEQHPFSGDYQEIGENIYIACSTYYKQMIDDGICPEQARMILPQAMYTEVIITGSLLYWARVYNQRSDEHAQKEVQLVAAQIDEIMTPLFPVSWKFLKEYKIG